MSPLKIFLLEAVEILHAEDGLARELSRLAESSHSETLKALLDRHVKETQEVIAIVERVLGALDRPVRGRRCHAPGGIDFGMASQAPIWN